MAKKKGEDYHKCLGGYEPFEANQDPTCDGGERRVGEKVVTEPTCLRRDRCIAVQTVAQVRLVTPETLLKQMSVNKIMVLYQSEAQKVMEEEIVGAEAQPQAPADVEEHPDIPGQYINFKLGNNQARKLVGDMQGFQEAMQSFMTKLQELIDKINQALGQPIKKLHTEIRKSKAPRRARPITGLMARGDADVAKIARKMKMPWYQANSKAGYVVIQEGKILRIPKTCPNPFRNSSAWGLVFRSYQTGGTLSEIISRARERLGKVRRLRHPDSKLRK